MMGSQPHGNCRASAEQQAGLRAPKGNQCVDLLRDSSQPSGGCRGVAQPAGGIGGLLNKVAKVSQTRMAKGPSRDASGGGE